MIYGTKAPRFNPGSFASCRREVPSHEQLGTTGLLSPCCCIIAYFTARLLPSRADCSSLREGAGELDQERGGLEEEMINANGRDWREEPDNGCLLLFFFASRAEQ